MDSLRKKPSAAFQKNSKNFEQKNPLPYFPKKEDIFISKDETERHEKIFRRGILLKKIFLATLSIFILAAIFWIVFFTWKTYAISKKITIENSEAPTFTQYAKTIISPIVPTGKGKNLEGESQGRINILLLGAAGKNKPGGNLTDTIMIASVDTKNKKVALLSLPRDFYVRIADTTSYSKINSIYQIGIKEGKDVELIRETVEKILDIPIDYYVVINFEGFEKVIDDIGGININNERDIYDTRYPGPNYSYETFELSKGFHKLDGATALKYVRERHADPDGDFGRARRQQQVIQAVKNKLFSAQTLLNVVALNNVLNTLGDNIKTDIAFDDIENFVALSKEVDMQNITNVVISAWEKDSLLKVSHIMFENGRAFILVPRVGNYSEIQDLARNIFNQDEIKKRQDAIVNENASVAIINKSGNSQLPYRIQTLLRDKLEIKNVHIMQNHSKDILSETKVISSLPQEKIYTLDELIKKLPATLDKNLSDNSNTSLKDDIIITLGSDLVETYKYEEDSVEDFQKYQDSDEYDHTGLNIEP